MFHVKGVNVVAKNEERNGGSVTRIFHIFIFPGTIYISAVDITIGMQKFTISFSQLYT